MADVCIVCERSLRRRRRHVLTEHFLQSRRGFVERMMRAIAFQEIPFDGTRSICHACWHRIDSELRNQDRPPARVASPVLPAVGASLHVPELTRAANTSRRCMINNCNNLQLRCVPNSIKTYLLSYYHLYIPDLGRICQSHLQQTPLEEFSTNIVNQHTDFNAQCIIDIVNMYTLALERRGQLDFENISEITEDNLHYWTGLNHEKFERLLQQTPLLRRESRTPRTDLGLFLCKLRTGEPNRRLGSILNIPNTTVSRKNHITRRCLLTDFVPLHLGLDHITRNDVINRNRVLPVRIFGSEESPKAIIICDGTYLFVEKSSNFLFQRQSYSLHKYRNLIKPFMIVCGDGYILDVTGPYDAVTSDADIMTKILTNHGEPTEANAFHYFFEEGDIVILDRGFRDSIPLLEEHGYVAHMPPSRRRGETQLTTEESNKSRLVTLCRWVVETVNGKFKRDYKLFRHRMFNSTMTNIFSDYKITAALINCFQESYEDSAYTNDFIQTINRNLHKPNLLAAYVQENNLNRQRVTFTRLEAKIPHIADFPEVSYDDLIKFAIGTYHLKISRSYCSEHVKATGVYEIEVFRHSEDLTIEGNAIVRSEASTNNVLIRCRIQSRHVRSKTYYTYVLYNTTVGGINAIKEYYCSCIHGQRTLGSCAHVISVIYFLGWARHNQREFDHPAGGLDYVLLDLENN